MPTANLNNLMQLIGLYNQMQAQSSGQPSLADQLNQQYAAQLAQANAANEYRYMQGLGELAGLRERSMGDIRSVGEQQRRDIDQNFRQAQSSADQDLRRRGLLGTSMVSSNARTLQEGRSAAQNRLAEQLAMARTGTDQSTTGNLVNFIQSRTDRGPDMAQLMRLQQGLGASGMMGGGMGGGGMVPFHMGPGSGGAGMQGGYPTVVNGQVQGVGNFGPGVGGAGMQSGINRWPGGMVPMHMGPGSGGAPGGPVWDRAPVHQGIGGGGFPMGGRRAATTDPVQQGMQSAILQALQAMNAPGGGGGGGQPMLRTAGDLNNSPFDANGRLVSTPRNPGFLGTNAPPATITMPGQFRGFQGGAPAVPGVAFGRRPRMIRGVGHFSRPRQRSFNQGSASSFAVPGAASTTSGY